MIKIMNIFCRIVNVIENNRKEIGMSYLKKCTSILLLSSMFLISSASGVYAQRLVSENDNIKLEMDKLSEEFYWQPGERQEIGFSITNKSSKKMTITEMYMIDVIEELNENIEHLEEYTYVSIKENSNKIVDNEKISEILTRGNTKINLLTENLSINSYRTKDFTMDISMDEMMGNLAQGQKKEFKIQVNYYLDSTTGSVDVGLSPTTPTQPDDSDVSLPSTPIEGEDTVIDTVVDDEVEGTIESPILPSEIIDDKLPQTGGIINGLTLSIIGIVLIAGGVILGKKHRRVRK
jgi:LPXTG-motif cell wall-anchored protein